ncbi:CidA/LrgA family protein [Zoogloea dura]|uniref:CidA/LrgA family protein n=1 Tax=Zoogloea dura TaxID=2728840 RepID=A0A848G518_9RHOO|nr:CidA/LrgA family protein [Zoogloea dura]NML26056.1 CidA/LrgA family protein [Zoogloea dura]
MIQAFALLLAFQLAGETLRVALHLPVPGPVLGMALLLIWLVARGGPGDDLRHTSGTLLQHLSLMFVPAGTGVMLHVGRLADEAWPIAIALVVSTVLGLAATGLTLHVLTRQGREASR